MSRDSGDTLKTYKDGGLSAARVYEKKEGLTGGWVKDPRSPNGFPKNNKFG